MRCETTSIIFDWTFDGPVNRIAQNKDNIVIEGRRAGRQGGAEEALSLIRTPFVYGTIGAT